MKKKTKKLLVVLLVLAMLVSTMPMYALAEEAPEGEPVVEDLPIEEEAPAEEAPPEPVYHQVVFDVGTGSPYAVESVKEGDAVPAPAGTPVVDGLGAFIEWQLGGAAYDFGTPVGGGFTLNALFAAPEPVVEVVEVATTAAVEVQMETETEPEAECYITYEYVDNPYNVQNTIKEKKGPYTDGEKVAVLAYPGGDAKVYGWKDAAGRIYRAGDEITVNGDMVLKGVQQGKDFYNMASLQFILPGDAINYGPEFGGYQHIEYANFPQGYMVTLPGADALDITDTQGNKYVITGWACTGEQDVRDMSRWPTPGYAPGSQLMVPANTNNLFFFAIVEKAGGTAPEDQSYTVVYDVAGGESSFAFLSQSFTAEDTAPLALHAANGLAKAGAEFTGWACGDAAFAGGQSVELSALIALASAEGVITLTATYGEETPGGGKYTIVYDIDGGFYFSQGTWGDRITTPPVDAGEYEAGDVVAAQDGAKYRKEINWQQAKLMYWTNPGIQGYVANGAAFKLTEDVINTAVDGVITLKAKYLTDNQYVTIKFNLGSLSPVFDEEGITVTDGDSVYPFPQARSPLPQWIIPVDGENPFTTPITLPPSNFFVSDVTGKDVQGWSFNGLDNSVVFAPGEGVTLTQLGLTWGGGEVTLYAVNSGSSEPEPEEVTVTFKIADHPSGKTPGTLTPGGASHSVPVNTGTAFDISWVPAVTANGRPAGQHLEPGFQLMETTPGNTGWWVKDGDGFTEVAAFPQTVEEELTYYVRFDAYYRIQYSFNPNDLELTDKITAQFYNDHEVKEGTSWSEFVGGTVGEANTAAAANLKAAYKHLGWEVVDFVTPGGLDHTGLDAATTTVDEIWQAYALYADLSEAEMHTLTYRPGATGTTGNAPAPAQYVHETVATIQGSNTLAREGYTFAGWTRTEGNGIVEFVEGAKLQMLKDEVLYGVWRPNFTGFDISLEGVDEIYDGQPHLPTVGGVLPGDIASYTLGGQSYTAAEFEELLASDFFVDATQNDTGYGPVALQLKVSRGEGAMAATTTKNATVSIARRPIALKVTGESKQYAGQGGVSSTMRVSAPTGVKRDLVAGQSITAGTATANGVNVGPYGYTFSDDLTIVANGGKETTANYLPSGPTGTFTVTPAPSAATAAAATFGYNGEAHEITYGLGDFLLPGDDAGDFALQFSADGTSWSSTHPEKVNVWDSGEVYVKAVPTTKNYEESEAASALLTITPRPVSVTANSATINLPAGLPPYGVSGYFTSRGSLLKDHQIAGVSAGRQVTAPGDYTVPIDGSRFAVYNGKARSAEADMTRNYDPTFNPGRLLVNAAPGGTTITTTTTTTPPPAPPAPPAGPTPAADTEPPLPEPPTIIQSDEVPTAGPESDVIDGEVSPEAGVKGASWALLNLMIAILGAVFALLLLLGIFVSPRRKAEDDESKTAAEGEKRSGIGWRLLAIVAGVAGIILFLLTENMRNPMIFTDRWTLAMVIVLMVQVLGMLLLRHARSTEKDPDATEEGQA